MTKSNTRRTLRPFGRLVPVFSAHDGLSGAALTLALAKSAASRGETALMLDVMDGDLMREAGIITGVSLGDVIYRGAKISDAKYISHNEHFTAAAAGDASLEDLLGSIAAMSLHYDWVFVGAASGCTPAHVSLAKAADQPLICYGTDGDAFMRAYWMIDAVRMRAPKFDPVIVANGSSAEASETFEMLSATISEFLGAPPKFGGAVQTGTPPREIAASLLQTLAKEKAGSRRAVS